MNAGGASRSGRGRSRRGSAAVGALLAALVCAAFAPHDPPALLPHAGVPATRRHEPLGARSPGATSAFEVGGAWHFRFEGDETIEYVVDPAHPDMQEGLIRVVETALSGGAVPVAQGGLSWRWGPDAGNVDSPAYLAAAASTTLIGRTFDEARQELLLTYREVRSNKVGVKSYAFRLEGKVLKIRLRSDATILSDWIGGYAGVRMAPVKNMPGVREQHIPFMDSVPVFVFDAPSGGTAFATAFVDWYRSNATQVDVQPPSFPEPGAMAFFMGTGYGRDSLGRVNAPIDDTVNVLVTRTLSALYPAIDHPRSPYHRLLAGRMVFNAPNNGPYAWPAYARHLRQLAAWGVDDLFGTMFEWERYGLLLMAPEASQAAGLTGCDPGLVSFAGRATGLPEMFPWLAPVPEEALLADPDEPANLALAHAQFGDVMAAARESGTPLSLYQDWGGLDPQGYGPYAPGQGPYPTATPLWSPKWTFAVENEPVGFGLLVPPVASGYLAEQHRVVRDEAGVPIPGWDSNDALVGTSWEAQGHSQHVISPTHMAEHLAEALAPVLELYDPTALFIDVINEVPGFLRIDHVADSGRANTIWRSLHELRTAIGNYKRDFGGPLLGENSHFRRFQWESFDSGLFDGRHRKFPVALPTSTFETPHEVNADSWVIPDFELRQVVPRASADAGMGREIDHLSVADWPALMAADGCVNDPPGHPYPLDCVDGDWHGFLDSWWTTLATYGHSPFITTNGHVQNNVRTMEGILREYYLLAALAEAQRASPVASIEYVHEGQFLTLEQALAQPGCDLKNPRLAIRHESGLRLWANHQVTAPDGGPGTDWVVDVKDLLPDGTPVRHMVRLPPNGFVASDEQGLLVFSARNPADFEGGQRIDYARVPGRWEMICTRGDPAQTFLGFPQPELLALLPTGDWAGHTVVRNDRRHLVLGASGGLWNFTEDRWLAGGVETAALPGPPPAPAALVLSEQAGLDTVSVGGQLGFRALLHSGFDAHGAPLTRDVTTLVSWTLDPVAAPPVARIDRNGALTGLAQGTVFLGAVWDDGTVSVAAPPLSVRVVPGKPVPAAGAGPVSAVAGLPVTLDGGGSSDPEGGLLAGWWEPGDGGPPQAGLRAGVVYHAPGDYAATLHVTDAQGHSASIDVPVHVAGAADLRWADDFQGSAPTGWIAKPVDSGWGLLAGSLWQPLTGGAFRAIAARDASLRTGACEVTVRMQLPSGAGNSGAGLHVRRLLTDDDPLVSGYAIGITPAGKVAIVEAGAELAATASAVIPKPFDPQRLRVELDEPGDGTLTLVVKVNGAVVLSVSDPTPQPGEGVGLATYLRKSSFDEFRVYAPAGR